MFVVGRIELAFVRPAFMDDAITVETTLSGASGAVLRFAQRIIRSDVDLLTAGVTVAAVRRGKPVRLPRDLRDALE